MKTYRPRTRKSKFSKKRYTKRPYRTYYKKRLTTTNQHIKLSDSTSPVVGPNELIIALSGCGYSVNGGAYTRPNSARFRRLAAIYS
jgi:hypothetical protein